MIKNKSNNGFAFVFIILLITTVAVSVIGYQLIFNSTITESQITQEKPREFKPESFAFSENQIETTSGSDPQVTETPLTVTPIQVVSQRKELQINSLGNVDLGGNFTAKLKSAWEQNNMIYAEVVLTNNYTSLLGINYNEFSLRGDSVSTRPTLSEEKGLNPGESKTITLIFRKLPGSNYTLKYYHPNHFVFELGTISAQ